MSYSVVSAKRTASSTQMRWITHSWFIVSQSCLELVEKEVTARMPTSKRFCKGLAHSKQMATMMACKICTATCVQTLLVVQVFTAACRSLTPPSRKLSTRTITFESNQCNTSLSHCLSKATAVLSLVTKALKCLNSFLKSKISSQ